MVFDVRLWPLPLETENATMKYLSKIHWDAHTVFRLAAAMPIM
jgi:hypothetical protein